MKDDQIRFEAQLTFLEKTVADLSGELYHQQKELDRLQQLVDKLQAKFESLEEGGGDMPHVRPPHY